MKLHLVGSPNSTTKYQTNYQIDYRAVEHAVYHAIKGVYHAIKGPLKNGGNRKSSKQVTRKRGPTNSEKGSRNGLNVVNLGRQTRVRAQRDFQRSVIVLQKCRGKDHVQVARNHQARFQCHHHHRRNTRAQFVVGREMKKDTSSIRIRGVEMVAG